MIVGAFGVSSNVDRMIVRLGNMGYGVATMPRNGLTQVEFRFPATARLEAVLSDLQQNVEGQAWIYNR